MAEGTSTLQSARRRGPQARHVIRPRPLVPYGLQALRSDNADVATGKISSLLHQHGSIPEGGEVSAIRACRLPFYRQTDLWEVEVARGQTLLGVVDVLVNEAGATVLDGRSVPIHMVNMHEGPALETLEQAKSYVHFFCNALSSEGLTFNIIESWSDICWRGQASAKHMAELEKTMGSWPESRLTACQPGRLHAWEADATMLFGANLFRVKLWVGKFGGVEMTDDAILATDLPVWQTRISRNLRQLD